MSDPDFKRLYAEEGRKALIYQERIAELERQLAEARRALEIIGAGLTTEFPGAPDVMNLDRQQFRGEMWRWSQDVAKAALDTHEPAEGKK